ncbi:MAG: 1-deoxy-D-xylulose-5-phosphate reductoisomerase [Paracoccaceae bacterium]|nr:1-deoxy-D-xylulose-5-phosphate reductoisomerase [Paracoccaceae bacterium]
MTRKVSIFGSTGSIGQNTVDLIARKPEDYDVVALTGGRNISVLAQQAQALNAKVAVTAHDECYQDLKDALAGTDIKVASGTEAIVAAAMEPIDWGMSAIIGYAGLAPGIEVLKQGSTLALANKETLVAAGPLVMDLTAKHNARLLPVDSEHSAIFQGLVGEDISAVEKITITASGGPFRTWSASEMASATLEQALAHPTWEMGQRISIDSASMFNKAMEVLETKAFFDVEMDQIDVLVHPQSLVHALVSFKDGAVMAHMGMSDMRHAIGYALNWPSRLDLPVARLDLARVGTLTFAAPDETRFPALRLAREVAQMGGLMGAAFNGAKEAALDLFMDRKIGFCDMAERVELAITKISAESSLTSATVNLENVAEMDQLARRLVKQ